VCCFLRANRYETTGEMIFTARPRNRKHLAPASGSDLHRIAFSIGLPQGSVNWSASSAEPCALFVTSLFFQAAACAPKALTPDDRVFPRIFRCSARQSRQNHDFYPTTHLHGGFVAM
jgi:hypothetical protein